MSLTVERSGLPLLHEEQSLLIQSLTVDCTQAPFLRDSLISLISQAHFNSQVILSRLERFCSLSGIVVHLGCAMRSTGLEMPLDSILRDIGVTQAHQRGGCPMCPTPLRLQRRGANITLTLHNYSFTASLCTSVCYCSSQTGIRLESL